MKTNVLVQYKGGGYDGCFWEWNYFFIDAEGKFFNIWASGRNGITKAEDVESVIDDAYTYDVSSDTEMRAFADKSNPVHVLGVVLWLIQHDMGDHAAVYCSKCGGIITDLESLSDDIGPDNPRWGKWKGDGGIGVQCEEVYCVQCT